MKTQVLHGSKQEIAEAVIAIPGEIREAIIIIQEPSDAVQGPPEEDIFAEMEPYTVKAGGNVDDSREAIYTRMPGE